MDTGNYHLARTTPSLRTSAKCFICPSVSKSTGCSWAPRFELIVSFIHNRTWLASSVSNLADNCKSKIGNWVKALIFQLVPCISYILHKTKSWQQLQTWTSAPLILHDVYIWQFFSIRANESKQPCKGTSGSRIWSRGAPEILSEILLM